MQQYLRRRNPSRDRSADMLLLYAAAVPTCNAWQCGTLCTAAVVCHRTVRYAREQYIKYTMSTPQYTAAC